MQKQIRIIAFLSILLFSSIVILIQPTFAQTPTTRSKSGNDALNFLDNTAERSGLATTNDAQDSLLKTVGNIINVILGFIGIIFFIQLFWSGFRWMTASGNEEVIKEAKETIKTAIIGIIIVFSAFLITNFTMNQIKKVSNTTSTVAASASSQ